VSGQVFGWRDRRVLSCGVTGLAAVPDALPRPARFQFGVSRFEVGPVTGQMQQRNEKSR
jgi:hypothetical protein